MANPPPCPERGFTLTELIVTVACLAIISSVAISSTGNGWKRGRVNTVAIELASWLEAVRNASLRRIGTGCTVTFNTTSPKAAGDQIASVSPAACSSMPSFTLTGLADSPDRYSVALSPTTPTSITFTPRGSVTATSDTDLKILLDGTGALRCIRTSATVGLIRIGSSSNAPSTTAACDEPFIAF